MHFRNCLHQRPISTSEKRRDRKDGVTAYNITQSLVAPDCD